MISDRKGFLAGELHITGNDINGLFTVSVGQAVIDLIGGDGLPDAVCILDVSGAYLVEIHLAKIVQQGSDGDALVGIVYEENVAQFKYEKRTLLIGEAKRWYTRSEYDTSSDNNGAGYSESFDYSVYLTLVPTEAVNIR